jgi:hypothetical protein
MFGWLANRLELHTSLRPCHWRDGRNAARTRLGRVRFQVGTGSPFPLNQRTFPPRDEESRGGGVFGARA